MTSTAAKRVTGNRAFQLKGSLFTLTVLQLMQCDKALFAQQLDDLVKQAPKFFQATPVVLDLQLLDASTSDVPFPDLCEFLRERGMVPIGVRGGSDKQHAIARAFGLALITTPKQDEPDTAIPSPAAKEKVPEPIAKQPTPASPEGTVVITRHVRSGQQIYAPNSDLTVIGSVSEGAELLASGSIHVYGTLRGRALAGINGDSAARIFCRALQAELVSIAGIYIASDSLCSPDASQAMQVYYSAGKLHLAPF